MSQLRIGRALGAVAVSALLAWPAGLARAQGAQPTRTVARPAPLQPPRASSESHQPPSKERIDKRLAQVKRRAAERRAKRKQRQHDRREALRQRLQRMLRDRPLTDEIQKELRTHARRVAQLRRIREIGAEQADYDLVIRVDKLISRENSHHDRWFRDLSRNRQPGRTPR